MLPVIPFLSLLAMAGGGVTLFWYDHSLSDNQKKQADEMACQLAKLIFNKQFEQLEPTQARHILAATQRHFGGN
jgi:hypothetical protein